MKRTVGFIREIYSDFNSTALSTSNFNIALHLKNIFRKTYFEHVQRIISVAGQVFWWNSLDLKKAFLGKFEWHYCYSPDSFIEQCKLFYIFAYMSYELKGNFGKMDGCNLDVYMQLAVWITFLFLLISMTACEKCKKLGWYKFWRYFSFCL